MQLSEDQRTALVLVDMEGYSVQEAADLLDCAPGTVKSRCSRGRARLVPLLTSYRRNRSRFDNVESATVGGQDVRRPEPAPPDEGNQ
jgi:RNA polymerase sigma-70 factor (ECF subfamily)